MRLPSPPGHVVRDEDEDADEDEDDEEEERLLEFGPTARQLNLRDPPERLFAGLDEEESLHTSLRTVQKILHKRDCQTTELHRQLREARQQLWSQTAEARAATGRLHDYLSDPSRAPVAQAEALSKLKSDALALSSQVADSRVQAKQWQNIARRQRAYFLQSENLGQESLIALRRHPCGEVFLVPPPVASVYQEEDREAGAGTGWDVGTSHCNPYKVDSWPFEPNVLAARASREPNLDQCAEGGAEDEEDDDEDELEAHFPVGGHSQDVAVRRLPRPPPGPQQQQWSDDESDAQDHEEIRCDASPARCAESGSEGALGPEAPESPPVPERRPAPVPPASTGAEESL